MPKEEKKDPSVEDKLNELNKVDTTSKDVESKTNDTEWLIKDKFPNTPEGIKALVKSHTEWQSVTDKKYNTLDEKYTKLYGQTKQLLALDAFINKSPKVVEFINQEIKHAKEGTKKLEEPKMPEDFNVADIYTAGTPSYDFRRKEQEYYKQLGVQEANERIGKLEKKIESKESDTKALTDLKVELGKQGLSKEEISGYLEFTNDPKNASVENSIVAYRAILAADKNNAEPTKEIIDPKVVDPKVKEPVKDKPVSAIADSGAAESAVDPAQIDKTKMWEGIMKHDNVPLE